MSDEALLALGCKWAGRNGSLRARVADLEAERARLKVSAWDRIEACPACGRENAYHCWRCQKPQSPEESA